MCGVTVVVAYALGSMTSAQVFHCLHTRILVPRTRLISNRNGPVTHDSFATSPWLPNCSGSRPGNTNCVQPGSCSLHRLRLDRTRMKWAEKHIVRLGVLRPLPYVPTPFLLLDVHQAFFAPPSILVSIQPRYPAIGDVLLPTGQQDPLLLPSHLAFPSPDNTPPWRSASSCCALSTVSRSVHTPHDSSRSFSDLSYDRVTMTPSATSQSTSKIPSQATFSTTMWRPSSIQSTRPRESWPKPPKLF